MRLTNASIAIAAVALAAGNAFADDVDELVAAVLGDTPVIDDLQELTDTIGGRPTGSDANRRAVAWAVRTLRKAEVDVTTEEFTMPESWRELQVAAKVSGDHEFEANAVSKPFSAAASRLRAPIRFAGRGTASDLEQLPDDVEGSWLLVETAVLDDDIGLAGLFAEFGDAARIEKEAASLGVVGVIYMSSRPKNLTYRHNAWKGINNELPLLVMEREHAKRIKRLLESGASLDMTATIDIEGGEPYTSTNVIAEIPGTSLKDEIVLFGAHLDSHDLGTGALDNGVNVAMLINIARQITRLNLKPKRTIRFALWNGEEQGLVGSWKYTEQHDDELDQHVVAASFDIGSGRTTGFFTGGRPELARMVDRYLAPVTGLGPFRQLDVPIVGTDNFDFMIEGVPNIVAAQSDANYASNYHAESDTFDKVDQYQVRLNSAIAAAVIWGFANDDERLPRQSHADIEALMDSTDLEQQMRNFNVWDGWAAGTRGRHD